MIEFNGSIQFVASDGGFELPRAEFSRVRDFADIVFFQPGRQVFGTANVKTLRA